MILLYSPISPVKSIFGMVGSRRQGSAPIAPAGRLHRSSDASGLAGCSFPPGIVFLLVLRFVSVAVLWFALPAVGYALVLPAVGFALLPAVGFALLPAVRSALSVLFIIAPDLRVLLAVLVPLFALLHILATGSSAVVLSLILTTGSLGVVPSVLHLQSDFVVGIRLRGSCLASPNTTAQHCATFGSSGIAGWYLIPVFL